MASKICSVRASDPSIEQRFKMLTGSVGLGMAAELLGGGKPPGGRKSAEAADRVALSGGTSGAICGGIQQGIIINGAGNGRLAGSSIGGKASSAVNIGLRSALEAVVEESGWETDSSASQGWDELERSCAAMDSNNVQIDCIDLTNLLEEGVAPADSDASSEDDNNEDRRDSDNESTNADECTPYLSAAAPASRPAARPASRLSHTFSPINRLDVTAAAPSPPPTQHRRSSFSSATESAHSANSNKTSHSDRAARGYQEPQVERDGKGPSGKYGLIRKYQSGSDSQGAQCHSDGSLQLAQGSPARRSPEVGSYAPHSGPLRGPLSESAHSGPLRHGFGSTSSLNSSHSGSPLCGAPRSESLPSGPLTGPHSGPLRHGFGSKSSLNSSHSGSMELGSSYGSSFGGSSFGGSSNDLTSGSCGSGLAGSEFKPSPRHVLLRQSSVGDVSPLVSHAPSVTVSAARLRPTSSGESGAGGEGRLAQAGQNKVSSVAPAAVAAGSCKPSGVTVMVKAGANPAAIEAYFKLKAQRGR